MVSGSSSSALVRGLRGDGRLAVLKKELKANEPVPELGEEEPQANGCVSASAEEAGDSLVSGSSFSTLVPGLGGDGPLALLGKELKANGPVPELGEEEPLTNEHVSASVEKAGD